jgi:hypothetical protein
MKRRKCPTCGGNIPEERFGIHFQPMQAFILDIISGAPSGIESDDLFIRISAVKDTFKRKTMKVHISNINDLLEGTGYSIGRYLLAGGGKKCVYYLAHRRGFGRVLRPVSR